MFNHGNEMNSRKHESRFFSQPREYQTIGGIVSKETVCCVGGKVKH